MPVSCKWIYNWWNQASREALPAGKMFLVALQLTLLSPLPVLLQSSWNQNRCVGLSQGVWDSFHHDCPKVCSGVSDPGRKGLQAQWKQSRNWSKSVVSASLTQSQRQSLWSRSVCSLSFLEKLLCCHFWASLAPQRPHTPQRSTPDLSESLRLDVSNRLNHIKVLPSIPRPYGHSWTLGLP